MKPSLAKNNSVITIDLEETVKKPITTINLEEDEDDDIIFERSVEDGEIQGSQCQTVKSNLPIIVNNTAF